MSHQVLDPFAEPPPPTIYVVDDELSVRDALDSMLRSVGYRVELFASGPAFLERAAQGLDGCAILDVRLPGMSGLEIQRRLKDLGVSIPIVFITGHGDIEMAVGAMKSGAVEFLPKPYREQALLEALDIAIDRQRRDSGELHSVRRFEESLKSLTAREQDTLALIAEGLEAKEIAFRLAISEVTVRIHRRAIVRKFGVKSVPAMVAAYARFLDGKRPSS
ncbi:MAG: response regulator transcription factor [Sphingomonadales bacterium]|nr:response regulator transcription factor [Sphingomonadales bacterium]